MKLLNLVSMPVSLIISFRSSLPFSLEPGVIGLGGNSFSTFSFSLLSLMHVRKLKGFNYRDLNYFCIGGDLLNSYFMEWPKEFLLLTSNLPVALSGGRIVMKIGITSFVSDITDPKDRTTRYSTNITFNKHIETLTVSNTIAFRLATFAFMGSLGRPIGIQVGAYLWEVGGYLAIFGTKIAGLTLTLVMLAIRLECFKWETKEMEVEREKSKREHQSGRGLGGRRHMLSILHFKVSRNCNF